MKTIIKIGYSENTKAVLAETKLEVEIDDLEHKSDTVFNEYLTNVKLKAKEIFEDAQRYALNQTKLRL